MSTPVALSREVLDDFDEIERIGTEAVERAQEENRRLGVPNAYSGMAPSTLSCRTGQLRRRTRS